MRISTFIDILSETTNSQPTKNTICQNVNAIHQECISHEHPVYFFSRPRRFGKSLLVSTLEAYFQGKKELFKGLAMEQLEKDWTVYPVLHIDFSLTKYTELTDLTGQLNLFLHRWEKIYGKDEVETTSAERLQGIILRAHKQTGPPIAVLIDEYDAPPAGQQLRYPVGKRSSFPLAQGRADRWEQQGPFTITFSPKPS